MVSIWRRIILYKRLFILLLCFVIVEYFFNTTLNSKSAIVLTKSPNQRRDHRIYGSFQKTLPFLRNKTNPSTNKVNFAKYFRDIVSKPPLLSNNVTNSVFDLWRSVNSTILPLCPDNTSDQGGRISLNFSIPTIEQLERSFSWLRSGGHWRPESCRVLKKVAIIVPYRNRGKHLLLFLQHMHPFLRRQQLDYTIFIVEQDGNEVFNRGLLMNVGYKEALKIRDFDCFIFHDVDLLPEDDRNLYTCPEQPRHMSPAIDIWSYRLWYPAIFGGVSAITKEHFELLNGFSNRFWGWGGEDDDLSNRIRLNHLYISRYPMKIARYTMLSHIDDKPNPIRHYLLIRGQKYFDKEGLNTLRYIPVQREFKSLYTWILVDIYTPNC